MIALAVFSLSLLTVLLSTPVVRQIGLRFGWVDHPGERKLHRQPIVRVGGIAIAIGTLLAMFMLTITDPNSFFSSDWSLIIGIVLGSVGFFAIGWTDDVLNLHPLVRLLLQAMVSVLVWALGIHIDFLPIPFVGTVAIGFLSLPITFLWLTGVANAINWLDGLDGLAAGISLLTALGLSILCLQLHQPAIALIALALAGATLGFLCYNAAPAKIFMGDGGSYFIGFLLAALSVTGLMQTPQFVINLLPFAVLAIPVVDMTFVILSRLMDGKSPFFPDQRHLHHRLLQLGCSRQNAVWAIYGLTFTANVGAISLYATPLGWIGMVGALLLLSLTNLRLFQQVMQIKLFGKASAA